MLFVTEWWQITARALRAAAQVLANHPDGLPRQELWRQITQRLPSIEAEWAEASPGQTTVLQKFSFDSVNLVKAGWLRKVGRRWYLAPPGRTALRQYTDPEEFRERAVELYAYWQRNRARFERAKLLMEVIPSGSWVSLGDLATEARLPPDRLVWWAQGELPPGWYQVLDADGGLPNDLDLTDAERDEWLELLGDEDVVVVEGRAQPGDRIPGPDLSQLVYDEEGEGGAVRRNAWLIRGSSVQGANLVHELWLRTGICSLPASRLRDLPQGAAYNEVQDAVDRDYSHANVRERARLVVEYHTFLSRIREGDIVVTNDGSDVFLGVIGGPPSFVSSTGSRANLQRPVTWRNARDPVDYGNLPDEISARLGNPDAELIDLTDFVGDLEQLLGEEPEQAVPDREMRLPDADEDLAKRLYMPGDQEWLQECVELLRERPQLIFHGPPGTGKTYLAGELALHLTGGRRENIQIVQFHPAYSYEDFFDGYRPVEDKDGTVAFRLRSGPLKLLAQAAVNHPGEPHVLIIDEINRGDLSRIFGELYFLLEYRGRAVSLLNGSDEGKGFTLPRNLIILGTMNTADRSIAMVDAAIRRRFWFTELHPDVPPVRDLLATWLSREGFPPYAGDLLSKLNEDIDDRDFKIGPAYVMRPGVQSVRGIDRVWRTQILPLLEERYYGELDHDEIADRFGVAALRRKLGLPEPGA